MDGKSPRFQMRSSALKLLDTPVLAANFNFVLILVFVKCIGSAPIPNLAERQTDRCFRWEDLDLECREAGWSNRH